MNFAPAKFAKSLLSNAVFSPKGTTRALLLFPLPASSATFSSSSSSSWLSSPGNPLIRWPSLPDTSTAPIAIGRRPPQLPPPPTAPTEEERADFAAADFSVISRILRSTADDSDINAALLRSGVAPSASLVDALLQAGGLRPVALVALSRWASDHLTPSNLTSLVDLLGKLRAFASAWSVILDYSPVPLSAFAALFRRYARVGMVSAAIRTFQYVGRHPQSVILEGDEEEGADLFELLIGALCKEGHAAEAAELVVLRRKEAAAASASSWTPSIRVYNMLLLGWFRRRKLRKAERLWAQIRQEGVPPTVVTFGTLIEGLCRMRRPEQAIELLEEMRSSGITANAFTCNPIVDALAEDGRFKEALGMVEKFPLYGVSPDLSTFNSLVKGFCKKGDLVGASQVLKKMIGRGICPTATTYNYFFHFFAKHGKIEEGMNLYSKMIQSGYSPDRLTYQLLIKMLCEEKRLDLAVQMIKEMNRNGFCLDLATGTMLVHLLCRLHRFEDACLELEGMIKDGITPQYITYRMLIEELKRLGMFELERKILDLLDSIPHSTKLPGTYREREGDEVVQRRKSIMKKAQVMSDALKTCKDPKELTNLKSSIERAVESAEMLIYNIRRRVYGVENE